MTISRLLLWTASLAAALPSQAASAEPELPALRHPDLAPAAATRVALSADERARRRRALRRGGGGKHRRGANQRAHRRKNEKGGKKDEEPDRKVSRQGCKPLQGYYPNYDDETCVLDDEYPNFMRTDVDFYFATEALQCCRMHFKGLVKSCLRAAEKRGDRWGSGAPPFVPNEDADSRQGCKPLQGYYPRYDDEICVRDERYPNFMRTDVDFYFSDAINECCRAHYKGSVKGCLQMSQHYEYARRQKGGSSDDWGAPPSYYTVVGQYHPDGRGRNPPPPPSWWRGWSAPAPGPARDDWYTVVGQYYPDGRGGKPAPLPSAGWDGWGGGMEARGAKAAGKVGKGTKAKAPIVAASTWGAPPPQFHDDWDGDPDWWGGGGSSNFPTSLRPTTPGTTDFLSEASAAPRPTYAPTPALAASPSPTFLTPFPT